MSDRSAHEVIQTGEGEQLLGRLPSPPDHRDWLMADHLRDDGSTPFSDATLSQTVQQLIDSGQLGSWASIRVFWKWLKNHLTPSPTPTPPPPTPGTAVLWDDRLQLDQGPTPHCVGFGCAQWGNTDPVNDNFANPDGHDLYYESLTAGGQPRAEDGSTVRWGAKALKGRGRIGAYVFAATLDDIKQWLLLHGPVIVGSDWYDGMFHPDSSGFIKATGSLRGGHCYLLVGYDPATDTFTFQNSWGKAWGQNGYFKMKAADFEPLFLNGGEACAGAELPLL